MEEIYVSTDVESDGPIPGEYSMLNMGAAAFSETRGLLSTFAANLRPLEAARQHPKTIAWRKSQPDAWAAVTRTPEDPHEVMEKFRSWLRGLGGKPVFVGYPSGFDFTFVYWYLMKFGDDSPFSFSAIDVKSFAMALLGTEFRKTVKRAFPRSWMSEHPHTHIGVDDAIEQGETFMNMLAARKGNAGAAESS